MDDSNLPVKRVIQSYFISGGGSESSSSDNSKNKKQKVQVSSNNFNYTNDTPTTSTASPATTRSTNTIGGFFKTISPPSINNQSAKFFSIFEAQSSKNTPPPSPPQVEEATKQATQPTLFNTGRTTVNPVQQSINQHACQQSPVQTPKDSSVSAFTIIKSMNNIRVSDPDSIPTPKKASPWTTPSRSSPRPLTSMKSTTSMDIDSDFGDTEVDLNLTTPLDNNNSNKSCTNDMTRRTMLPWPDSVIFMGGHIRQCSSPFVEDTTANLLHYRFPALSPCQHIIQTEGNAYLESLRQRRQSKMSSATTWAEGQQHNTTSPTMLSSLRISSPTVSLSSSTSSSSSSTKQQLHSPLSSTGARNLLQHDIELKMDSLYPLDTSDGWRYPACEGLLERYSNGEWTTKAGSSTTTEHNVNWCDKYRPDKVIYLLDNQSHHCYLRDWLERHKVAPTKTDPSFFAPRKKVTRRDMENHYTKDYDDGGGDEDDDFMPTAQFTKKNRSPKKRNKKDLNMILLVGPHGVGKTAGVFTAARETGYQVFEIHPGLKRSLKEVHRLVGDMTKNHLVRFHKQGDDNKPGGNQPYLDKSFGGGDSGDDDNDGYGNSDLDMDADSQQTTTTKSNQLLTQFFISKSTTTRPKQPTQPSSHVSTKQDQLSMATQQQYGPKQSLILLEEVDLVYQSDKGFWNGVTDLARTSKRPIILTCNDISVIPFDILQLQAIIHYEAPLRQLLLPYLHLICLIEGYDISVLDLTAWVNLIGPDIRQLLMTLEYLHYQQGPLLLGDNQSYRMPLSHNSNHDNNAMLQSHMDLLMNQAENDTMQQQQQPWLHISDHIPGAQMTPLCMQLVENDSRPTRLEITNEPLDNDNNDEVLEKLVAWMDNRSLIDYGVGMDDIKISQIYGLDEYGPNDDQTSGHLHSWKKSNDWDHCDMQAYMESSLLDMNHPQKGSGLIDIMSWEMICDQRNKQKEEDTYSVEHILNCRYSMALGSVGILDISYSKQIEQLRQLYTRRRRRMRRRVLE